MSPTGLALANRRNMPTKKSGNVGTRKSSTDAGKSDPLTQAAEPKLPKPMESEIVVQDPPKPPEQEHALPEDLLTITGPKETPFTIAKEHLYTVLWELQQLHDTVCKTNTVEITMEQTTFTKIATKSQQVWE